MLTHSEHAEGEGSYYFFFFWQYTEISWLLVTTDKLVYPNQYRLPGGFPRGSDGKETA